MKYIFEVQDLGGNEVFRAEKPTIEMLEEEIGRFERHIQADAQEIEDMRIMEAEEVLKEMKGGEQDE